MKIENAPPAGWYPDPEGTSRLRWWEGADWSDRYRARPVSRFTDLPEAAATADGSHRWVPDDRGLGNRNIDTQLVVEQVRLAAREEAERAAAMFGQQARSAARGIQPLITEYTSKLKTWLRRLGLLAVILATLWVLWQFLAQASLMQWIGDRIDEITDQNAAPVRSYLGTWLV